MNKALIIVDVQNDFLPGGALGVTDGDEVLPVIQGLIDRDEWTSIVVTRDFHPEQTKHFEKWPVHCVQGTPGALIHEPFREAADTIITKGTSTEDDGYSGFEGTDQDDTPLDDVLGLAGVREVVVVGLALDYCVKATALDAVKCGYHVTVPLNATRPVEWPTAATSIYEMQQANVNIVPEA
jgi:nicotinamidase/pyrazinamidase